MEPIEVKKLRDDLLHRRDECLPKSADYRLFTRVVDLCNAVIGKTEHSEHLSACIMKRYKELIADGHTSKMARQQARVEILGKR